MTTIDPFAIVLEDIPPRISTESFTKNPIQRRQALINKLEAVANQIQQGAFNGASKKLQNDIREKVEDWLTDQINVPANFYTKSELLELIDELIARTETLAQSGHPGNGSNSRGHGGNRGNNGRGD